MKYRSTKVVYLLEYSTFVILNNYDTDFIFLFRLK